MPTSSVTLPSYHDGLVKPWPDAARWLDISRSTLFRLMNSGELEYVRIGADRRIPKAALVDYVLRHRVRHA